MIAAVGAPSSQVRLLLVEDVTQVDPAWAS
jgi:hypothetical protein